MHPKQAELTEGKSQAGDLAISPVHKQSDGRD